MKIFAHKLRKNLAIIFAAAVSALVIFFIVKNPGFFQASILSLEEKAFMNEKKRDAAYKTSDKTFEIFIAEKHKTDTKSFQGIIYFDPTKVEINATNSTGQGTIKITTKTKDSLLVTITTPEKIETNEEILGLTFSGSAKDIILGESKIRTKKGRSALSVGNLNEFNKHSK